MEANYRDIRIWFGRFFSTCKICGQLMNDINTYHRKDTRNRLHSYCKQCYIQIQKDRNDKNVKVKNPVYLINDFDQIIIFDDYKDRQKYIKERKTMAKFGYIQQGYSSIVGCTEINSHGDIIRCDQCGGTLLYDDHGDLVCQSCNLICDEIGPMQLERNLDFDTVPKHKFDTKESNKSESDLHYIDDGCFDFYYSRAYSKYSRK